MRFWRLIRRPDHRPTRARCEEEGCAGTLDGCDLAVRIDGQAYYVDETAIDEHGDAHGEGGFCNTVRRAKVTGSVVDGRYAVTTFVLLPVEGGS